VISVDIDITAERARAVEASEKLLAYCRAREWAGHDPYDALNSRLLTGVPILDIKPVRLVITQALKRSPIDLRRWLLIPPTQNPKALGLFLAAALKRPGAEGTATAEWMIDRLSALRSAGTSYWCWGYSFPWQTRTLVVPRGTPNLVCTTFVADALLDAYERLGHSRCLTMAVSAGDYIVKELYRAGTDGSAGFSYPLPTMPSHIHNANLLAAALLCRIHALTGEQRFLEPALAAARWSVRRQRADGSWPYGEGRTQQWIDNFHTGYNLGALRSIGRSLGTDEFELHVQRGFTFYRAHFFTSEGIARYFHNETYPIDIHCVAQSLITLTTFRDLGASNETLAYAVLRWALDNMWDDQGFFYYRVLRMGTIRTSYMRWSQAWMLLALAHLLEAGHTAQAPADTEMAAVPAPI